MYRNVFFSHITLYLSSIYSLLIHHFDSESIYLGINNMSPVATHASISLPQVLLLF